MPPSRDDVVDMISDDLKSVKFPLQSHFRFKGMHSKKERKEPVRVVVWGPHLGPEGSGS